MQGHLGSYSLANTASASTITLGKWTSREAALRPLAPGLMEVAEEEEEVTLSSLISYHFTWWSLSSLGWAAGPLLISSAPQRPGPALHAAEQCVLVSHVWASAQLLSA